MAPPSFLKRPLELGNLGPLWPLKNLFFLLSVLLFSIEDLSQRALMVLGDPWWMVEGALWFDFLSFPFRLQTHGLPRTSMYSMLFILLCSPPALGMVGVADPSPREE